MSIDVSKVILNVTNLSDIEEYKEVGITNFLFPIEGFSVGYDTSTLESIGSLDVDAYLLVNRILTDDDIDEFLKLNIPQNVKGIFLEDTGLYYALKDRNLELINFQNHLNNNYKTVNYWLNFFDSVVLSTDITLEDGKKIVEASRKPLVVYAVGYPEIMYSRRNLLKNYHTYMKDAPKTLETVTIPNNDTSFIFKENDYGTVVFPKRPLDAREESTFYDSAKIKFFIYDTNMIDKKTMIDLIRGLPLEIGDKGFLYKNTVYRIGDIK